MDDTKHKEVRGLARLASDSSGAVIVETAFALPLLIVLLLGVVTYGMWFAAAHALQETANSAARATFGSIDAAERQEQVDKAVSKSLEGSGLVDADEVTTRTALDGVYYSVTLTYDISDQSLFRNSIVPLPGDAIVRSAVVEVSGS